jgi:hypothetical protein
MRCLRTLFVGRLLLGLVVFGDAVTGVSLMSDLLRDAFRLVSLR